MKGLHFCTPQKQAEIRTEKEFYSLRTGFVPTFFEGETIKINFRDEQNKDTLFCQAIVLEVQPIQFQQIKELPYYKEEIERYGRKFDNRQWFFRCKFLKIKGLL